MKKTYTKKQITEAIAYWKNVLAKQESENRIMVNEGLSDVFKRMFSSNSLKRKFLNGGDDVPEETKKTMEKVLNTCKDPDFKEQYSFYFQNAIGAIEEDDANTFFWAAAEFMCQYAIVHSDDGK